MWVVKFGRVTKTDAVLLYRKDSGSYDALAASAAI